MVSDVGTGKRSARHARAARSPHRVGLALAAVVVLAAGGEPLVVTLVHQVARAVGECASHTLPIAGPTAPVPTAPVPTAPVPTAPVPTAPVPSAVP